MKLKLDSKFPFGKYSGQLISDCLFNESYIAWWNKTITEYPIDEEVFRAIKNNWKEEQKLKERERKEKQYIESELQYQRKCNPDYYNRKRDYTELDTCYDEDDGIIFGINGF